MRSRDTTTLLQKIFGRYRGEGIAVPYTLEDFKRDLRKETLDEMTPEEIRDKVPHRKYVEGMSEEELAQLEEVIRQKKAGSPGTPETDHENPTGK